MRGWSERPFALAIGPVRRPLLTLAITGLCVLVSLLGIRRIEPSTSIESMIGAGSPAAAALNAVLERFESVEEMLVLVRLPDGAEGGEAGVQRLLTYADRLEAEVLESAGAWCRGAAHRPDPALVEFATREIVPTGLWYVDGESFEGIRRRLSPEQMGAQLRQNEAMIAAPGPGAEALARVLLQDPLRLREFFLQRVTALRGVFKGWRARPEFLTEDGRALLIRLAGREPPNDLDFAQGFTGAVERAIRRIGKDGLAVDLAGSYAIAAHSATQIRADIKGSVIQTVILLQLLFLAFYRNPLSFAVVFAPVAVGIVAAFGLHGLVSRELSPLTGAVGAMLAGLGIDYGIHYLSHVETERARGLSLEEGAGLTVRRLAGPMTIACGSAVAAFAVLCVSGVNALRQFALLGAAGLALVLLASLVVIPAMLALMPERVRGARLAGPRIVLAPLAIWVARRRAACAVVTAAVLMGAVAVLALGPGPAVAFERDLRVMHPQPNPPLEAQARIVRQFGGGESLLVYIHSPTAEGLVASAHAVARALASPEAREVGVIATFGLDQFLPDPAGLEGRAQQIRALDAEAVLNGFDAALRDSSFEPGAFDNYRTFLRTLLSGRAPPDLSALDRAPTLKGLLLERDSPAGGVGTMTTVFFGSPLETSQARAGAVEGLRRALAGIPGAVLTGIPVLGHDAERTVRADLSKAVLLGAPLVIALLVAYFRRARDIALVLIPAVFSLAVLLAFMKLRSDSFNMANMAAVPLMIGLGVDCGIFLVSIARQCRAEGRPVEELVRRQGSAAHAMFMTSAPNVLGLWTLTTTATPAIQSLGWALGVGVAACWAGSIFLLSPLLVMLHGRGMGGDGRPPGA